MIHPFVPPFAGSSDQHPPSELDDYAQPADVFNPLIHRIDNAIRARALYPDKEIPPIPRALLEYTAPPAALVDKARREVDALIGAAEVKKGTFLLIAAFSHLCSTNTPLPPPKSPPEGQGQETARIRQAPLRPRRRRPALHHHR